MGFIRLKYVITIGMDDTCEFVKFCEHPINTGIADKARKMNLQKLYYGQQLRSAHLLPAPVSLHSDVLL